LDAAVQVLAKEGANRFTTARVTEKAGVSVGSLYQYFPKGGDPLPAPERRMAADERAAAQYP
jgi:AcrR family transcriptional regulator